MITLSEKQARKLVNDWSSSAFTVERAALNDYQRGAADAYEAAARSLREELKKNEEAYQQEQLSQVLEASGRNDTRRIIMAGGAIVLIPICYFVLFTGIFYQSPAVLPTIFLLFLVVTGLNNWQMKKSNMPFVYIFAGIGLVVFSILGKELQTAVAEVMSTIGGQLMGAALAAGLILWLRESKDLKDIGLAISAFMIGLLIIFYYSDTGFLSVLRSMPNNLGFELLGAGVTVLVISGWIAE